MSDDRIICTCMNVSVQDIKDAIAAGATTLAEIQDKTGLGSVCGVCVDDAEMLINELLNN